MRLGVCGKCNTETELYNGKRICRACNTAYHRAYYEANRDRMNAQGRERHKARRESAEYVEKERARGREYWQKLRDEVYMAYGGYICACCGETEPKFLSIDHIFNDGAEHRREIGEAPGDGNGKGKGGRTLKWLKDHSFPSGFQVLCMNCNMGKARNGGVCPHKTALMKNPVNSGEIQNGQS